MMDHLQFTEKIYSAIDRYNVMSDRDCVEKKKYLFDMTYPGTGILRHLWLHIYQRIIIVNNIYILGALQYPEVERIQ